jgi:autotransporter-associated beta strand protein
VLNGFGTPGRTIVKNGGELRCRTFRLSQNSTTVNGDIPTQLHLITGGVVRCREFTVGGNNHACRIDFDGGGVRAIAGVGSFFGNSSAEWPNVPVYVHEGGAVFDSNGYNIGVHLPLTSAAANDGGLTKKGAGTLTLSKANTYNGPTRVLGGKVTFQAAAGFPGGDIEIDAEELASRGANDPFISSSASITFNSGSKLRILVPAGFDLARLRMNRAVVTSASPMSGELPTAVVVDAETGAELSTATHIMRSSFNATCSTLSVRSFRRGTIIIVK